MWRRLTINRWKLAILSRDISSEWIWICVSTIRCSKRCGRLYEWKVVRDSQGTCWIKERKADWIGGLG